MTILNAFQKTFGNNYKNFKGDIGLEIETETRDEYKVPKFSFWDVHADGSLRGFGQEYVLKQPLDFEKTLPEALKEFTEKTKGIAFAQDSITTSVHVHLNLLNDNFIVLGNFLTLYSFVENILIRFSGDDRLSNLFCLPICDAEETYHNILRVVEALPKKKYGSLQFEIDSTKYGALNLSALVRYGSLEIRSFRGTTDTGLIYDWVGILYSILKFARQKGLTPPDIIRIYKDKGVELLSDVFGEYRKYLRHKDEQALLDQNLWYAVNIACSAVKDWAKLEEVVKDKKFKLKDLDTMAKLQYGEGNTFETLSFDQQQFLLRNFDPLNTPTENLRPRGTILPTGLRTTPTTLNWIEDDPPVPPVAVNRGVIVFTPNIRRGDPPGEVVWNGITYTLMWDECLMRDEVTGDIYVDLNPAHIRR